MRRTAWADPVGQVSVIVLHRGPRLAPAVWDGLVSGLPEVERRRIARLHRWEDRQASAVGWQLLQRLAAERGGTVRRGRNGRPGADPPLDVSLSHSGGWIAAAAGQAGRIGIDAETLREVTPALAARCLSAAELAWLDHVQPGGSRNARFLQLWTAKEAYLKATGDGLGLDPRTVSIDHVGTEPQLVGPEADRWRFVASTPAPGLYVTVCVERTP